MEEARKYEEQMNINRMLRAENDDLKLKLTNETRAKNEEVNKRQVTVKKFKDFKNGVKVESKVCTETMVMMDEEITQLQEQLNSSQEHAINIQFEGQLQVSEKQTKITELEEELRVSREQAKDLHREEQLKVTQQQAKNNQFEGEPQVSEQEAKIIDLQEQLKVSREKAKHDHHEKQQQISQQQAKINRLEKKLRASREEVKVCEDESTNYLTSFHDAARKVASTDRQLHFQSEENKRLQEEVASLLKYKQNYRLRTVNCTWIKEELDQLERVTTNFSFRRRSSTKRALINRLRDLIDRTMKMRYDEEDKTGNQGSRLRR